MTIPYNNYPLDGISEMYRLMEVKFFFGDTGYTMSDKSKEQICMYYQSMNNSNLQSTRDDVGSILRNLLETKLSDPICGKINEYFSLFESRNKHD